MALMKYTYPFNVMMYLCLALLKYFQQSYFVYSYHTIKVHDSV